MICLIIVGIAIFLSFSGGGESGNQCIGATCMYDDHTGRMCLFASLHSGFIPVVVVVACLAMLIVVSYAWSHIPRCVRAANALHTEWSNIDCASSSGDHDDSRSTDLEADICKSDSDFIVSDEDTWRHRKSLVVSYLLSDAQSMSAALTGGNDTLLGRLVRSVSMESPTVGVGRPARAPSAIEPLPAIQRDTSRAPMQWQRTMTALPVPQSQISHGQQIIELVSSTLDVAGPATTTPL